MSRKTRESMAKWVGISMFIIIFAGICLAGYYYILSRLFSFFKLKHNLWFWIAWLVLGLGYIGFSILERKFPCGVSHWLLRFSSLALGIGWLCLVILLCHDLLHLVFRFPIHYSRWVAVGAVFLLSVYALLNTLWIQVKSIDLPAPVDLKIVQLSDVHYGSVSRRHLRRLIQKTNALNPDLVVITGDLLDADCQLKPGSLAPLNELTAPSYWISGNHERYIGLSKVMAALKQTPVIPLRDKALYTKGIQLIGIDDSEDHTRVQQVLPGLHVDPDKFTILLYHRPDGFDAAAKAGIDLMLTGHTHNGQIWPFNYVVETRFKYVRGLHRIDGMMLWVTTGSGTWGPPMRLGSRNQITLIQLQKKD